MASFHITVLACLVLAAMLPGARAGQASASDAGMLMQQQFVWIVSGDKCQITGHILAEPSCVAQEAKKAERAAGDNIDCSPYEYEVLDFSIDGSDLLEQGSVMGEAYMFQDDLESVGTMTLKVDVVTGVIHFRGRDAHKSGGISVKTTKPDTKRELRIHATGQVELFDQDNSILPHPTSLCSGSIIINGQPPQVAELEPGYGDTALAPQETQDYVVEEFEVTSVAGFSAQPRILVSTFLIVGTLASLLGVVLLGRRHLGQRRSWESVCDSSATQE